MKKMRELLRNRRGFVLDTITTIIVVAVGLVIGAIVIAQIFASVSVTNYSTAAQLAINNTQTTVWNAWAILPIVMIVLAAVAVISAVMILKGRQD